MAKRILSGVQPSGALHLGNSFGAIAQWLAYQDEDEYECFFFIADLHSLTSVKDANHHKSLIDELIITYLACGLDPNKVVLFRQSQVSEHLELYWILSNVCSMGLMERAHSYKDKTAKGISPNVGLFTYPILMAADILLYQADTVPVGKDQKQHLEMTRDIVEKFHHQFGEVFVLPEVMIKEEVSVVPGTDGQKMSKSYNNTIPLWSSEEGLKKAVFKIVTDSATVEDKKTAEGNTLYELMKLISPEKSQEMKAKMEAGGYGYGHAKQDLFEITKAFLEPIWEKTIQLRQKPDYVRDILEEGKKQAKKEASATLNAVKAKVGLI